jgi:hypothetical protein
MIRSYYAAYAGLVAGFGTLAQNILPDQQDGLYFANINDRTVRVCVRASDEQWCPDNPTYQYCIHSAARPLTDPQALPNCNNP